MATAKAAAQRKAATRQAKASPKAYVAVRAFTLASTGEVFLIGEPFAGTDAQAKALMERGYVREE